MDKIRDFCNTPGGYHFYAFHCPGCGHDHGFNNSWKWNGSLDKPTFTPSLLNWKDDPKSRCHLFVTEGKIKFLKDCWHPLAGKTVDMPDYEDTRRTMSDEHNELEQPQQEAHVEAPPPLPNPPVETTVVAPLGVVVAAPVEQPKPLLAFPRRVWHKDGLHASRVVASAQELHSMGPDWTTDVPAPKKPLPLHDGEIHAKQVALGDPHTPTGDIHAKAIVPKN